MKVKVTVVLIFLLIFQISGYGFNRSEITVSKNENKIQIGIYTNYSISTNIKNAQGNHRIGGIINDPITPRKRNAKSNNEAFAESIIKTPVEGINIKQKFGIGINARYYFIKNFGIEADAAYTKASFPEQRVTLGGFSINQPKSDLNFFTISVGPAFVYKGKGMWQVLNPYTSISLAVLFGNASDVNLLPVYGKGGNSTLSGIGFNIHLGLQYLLTNNFILSGEYRFEYLSSEVDHFRSFTEGLSFDKNSSYLLLGLDYSF